MSNKRSALQRMITWFVRADPVEAQTALDAIKGVMDGKAPAPAAPVKARRGRKPKAAETEAA